MAILDPEQTDGCIDEIDPPLTLPPRVRTFGFLPDEKKLLPGDLLLVSGKERSKISNFICRSQADAGLDEIHACWHHAAIYLYDGELCEAVPIKGVRLNSLYEYVGDCRLRFRRPRLPLTDEERWKLCINATRKLREKYSYDPLPDIYTKLKQGWWHPLSKSERRQINICSQLYANAYLATTGKLLDPKLTGYIFPAHLSATGAMADVELGRQRIKATPQPEHVTN